MQAISGNGKIVLPYYAKDAHIVATGPDVDIQISLDGKTIKSDYSGQDTKNGLFRYQNIGRTISCQVHSLVHTLLQ